MIEDDPAYTAEETLPELIEAAIGAGDYEAAATAHKTLSERALAAGTPWALGLHARCEALLTEGADAEGYYLESISQLSSTQRRELSSPAAKIGTVRRRPLTGMTPSSSRRSRRYLRTRSRTSARWPARGSYG